MNGGYLFRAVTASPFTPYGDVSLEQTIDYLRIQGVPKNPKTIEITYC